MAASAVESVNRARVRSMIVPREHGAWGLLLMPLVSGAAIALLDGSRGMASLAWFSVAALALFWLRTPVESLLGTSPFRPQGETEREPVVAATGLLVAIAALALTALLWGGRNRDLFLIGAAAALAFVLQAGIKKMGRVMRMPAQIVGVIGLSATAPAAYYVVTGRLDERALSIWLANWLFAAGQVHFVQLRIHAARVSEFAEKLRRGRGFLAGEALLVVALITGWKFGILPGLALLAFLPALTRALRWFVRKPQPLAVRALGWWEVAHSIIFGLLLVLAFSL